MRHSVQLEGPAVPGADARESWCIPKITAAEELLPLVYEELRRLAQRQMGQQPEGQTLQATARVHEAWLKLAGHSAAS